MKRILQIANIVSLIAAIAINYAVGTRAFNNPSIGEISDKYENLLTPAGYAFGIWGLIYISLAVFVVFQAKDMVKKDNSSDFVLKIGWWFVLSNLANAAWIFAFSSEEIGLSVILTIILLLCLIKITANLNMERWDAPVPKIVMVWWPISIYFGWLTVATVANTSLYFTKLGWDGSPLSPSAWAILMILITGGILLVMIQKRNMREYAIAGAWGIIAIAAQNWGNYPWVSHIAIAVALLIIAATGLHAYKNRATSIPNKLRSKT